MFNGKRKLKPLRGRKWHETAVGVYIIVSALTAAAIYFEIVDPVHAIGAALFVAAGSFANRIDEMDKQIIWLTERERQRLLDSGDPIFEDKDFE